MDSENTFKTKTGFCHVLPDRIVLSKDGNPDAVTKSSNNNTVFLNLLVYAMLSALLFYLGYNAMLRNELFQAIFACTIASLLIYVIIISLNNSSTPIIKRSSITEVKLNKAARGLTKTHFIINFTDDNGKPKKRLIILPGSFSNGNEETERAIEIMLNEKLI